jgi:hypothetical protein
MVTGNRHVLQPDVGLQHRFRDINFGRWLRLLTKREYDLKEASWARTVSGFHSLLIVYLIALWVLTYFGMPFGQRLTLLPRRNIDSIRRCQLCVPYLRRQYDSGDWRTHAGREQMILPGR